MNFLITLYEMYVTLILAVGATGQLHFTLALTYLNLGLWLHWPGRCVRGTSLACSYIY